jgi:hypothetical protein
MDFHNIKLPYYNNKFLTSSFKAIFVIGLNWVVLSSKIDLRGPNIKTMSGFHPRFPIVLLNLLAK